MTKEELQKLAEKMSKNEALEQEKALFFETLRKLLSEMKEEIKQ